jgi:hypothetical protein
MPMPLSQRGVSGNTKAEVQRLHLECQICRPMIGDARPGPVNRRQGDRPLGPGEHPQAAVVTNVRSSIQRGGRLKESYDTT